MTMVFESVRSDGISQLSYFVGDDGAGIAAVVDPRPDVDVYLMLSHQYGVTITHVFETHIHADFMSGARELVQRVGSAKLYASGEADASYDFEVEKIHRGDRFEFGSLVLTTRHTPGHTPEHVAFELAEKGQADKPWGVFTGDSLFVGSVGRPDLLGDEKTDELVEQLFHTMRDYYLKLDDGVIIYPCHGAGSACGADIGERPMSTIAYERRTNEFLQRDTLDDFKKFVQQDAPPVPHHYPVLKKMNVRRPQVLAHRPVVPGLPPHQFQAAIEKGEAQLVDTRHMLAFGGGHIPGAINLGDRPELSVWAGDMLSYDNPILLIVEDETQLDWIVWHFAYVGLLDFSGYLVGGMKAWENAGLPLVGLPQMPVQQLNEKRDRVQLLDVRAPGEFESFRIPGAKNHFVSEMRDGVDGSLKLDRSKPTAVYCGSGYRASIAASILQREGFQDIYNVPGSMQAWQEAGYDVEK